MINIKFLLLYESIVSALEKYNRSQIFLISNMGNSGDALIRLGTIKFLNDFDLRYIEIHPESYSQDSFGSDALILYGGSGAWCNAWKNGVKNVTKLASYAPVIVLPSTYELPFEIDNVTFFCRELESMKNVKGEFCHDMAFYLNMISSGAPKRKNGYFFRKDKESLHSFNPPDNNDISGMGRTFDGVYSFLEVISRHENIFTDRLHVSIAASLLGRKCYLFGNNYFKNKAIFAASIAEFYPNTSFIDQNPRDYIDQYLNPTSKT
jgi:exopolysaccharide biosynthesis predicted pyruvyltransferase EpsI